MSRTKSPVPHFFSVTYDVANPMPVSMLRTPEGEDKLNRADIIIARDSKSGEETLIIFSEMAARFARGEPVGANILVVEVDQAKDEKALLIRLCKFPPADAFFDDED